MLNKGGGVYACMNFFFPFQVKYNCQLSVYQITIKQGDDEMISKLLKRQNLFCLLFLLLLLPALVYPQRKTKKDIIIASQLPEERLKNLSTDELLERCLNYPYIADVMFAQNIPLMFKYIRQEFNGFNELFGRQDAAQVILNRFLNFDFNKITDFQQEYEKGLYIFKFCYLNLLLAQNEIMDRMGKNYDIINQINKKYSDTKNKTLAPFRSVVPITFVGYNMLKYLENTDLGKSSELLPLVSVAQLMHISSLDYATFEYLSEFVTTNIEGK
jgi:hypothetical protein